MPTLPFVSRQGRRSSLRILIFLGGPSRSGNSADNRAGIQKRRINAPIAVPGPLCVSRSLSALLSMPLPSLCRCFLQRLLQSGNDVARRFDAYRQADHVRAGAGGHALLLGELAVG